MSERGRSARHRRGAVLAVVLSLGFLPLMVATSAHASGGETGLITISPATPSAEPSGSPTTYSIAVSCEGTAGSSCGGGSDATITVPLVGTNTVPANMSGWTYSAVTGTSGLIDSGPTVVSNGSGGYNLVFDLDNTLFIAGYSGTITLKVTPPDNTTPNHTTWTLTPTLAGGNITSVSAPTPATGEATATPLPVITKITNDGGSVYVAGSNVTYDIDANCNTGDVGNLYMTNGSLSDPLPTGMAYVSSSPAGAVYNAGTNTVTWTFATASSTPAGCASGSTGATSYQIVATTPDPAPAAGSQPLKNIATFAGEGPDATNGTVTGSTDAEADIDVVQTPPTGNCSGAGCPTISKSSLAPLAITSLPDNQYQGTYAGAWIATSSTPTYSIGAAPGSYQVDLRFPLTGTYETQVVDPLPCLSNVSGTTYSSDAPTATACTDPAFDTSVIEVSGPGLGEAVAQGWAPTATETDNASETLTATGSVAAGATSAYYSIPDVGDVADIVLPATPYLEGDAITLALWGYAASSLLNTDVLANTATATASLNGTPLGSITASANLYIVGQDVQLGLSKSFGSLGGGPGGTTVLNIKGAVSFPGTLANDVVLTDLLPSGLDWSNQSSSGSFTLSQGAGTSSVSATATVAYLPDYEDTGRDLIRVTIPHADFTAGYWTISPPTNFFELTTPTAIGTYANTDQIFLYGYAPTQIDPACTTPTQTGGGISPAALESYNPYDLAGDGKTQEDYCQNSATLVVEPSGAAFSLTKTVQGNLDPAAKGALGIGDASAGGSGTGTYVLQWSNVGSDTLDDPVIYDILPYVGDTGVSEGQADVSRGSQFAPTFASVGTLPTGVTVEYSQSTNPCRNQVYADSANTGCVNDWSTTAPTDLSDVKALEFIDLTNQYPQATAYSTSGFSVSFTVTVPNGDVNEVAWNSAATNASDVSNPSSVPLPSEPPKVGLTATSGGPSMATTTTVESALAYSTTPMNDTVTILGTAGNSGTLDWSFVGPVYPVPSGGCDAVTGAEWSAAATAASGSGTTPAADGAVTVGPANVQGQGCYSWTESLTLDNGGGTASVGAGAEDAELVQADPYQPTLSTTATPALTGSDNTSTDAITVDGSGIGIGNGAPTSAPLGWDLYGPATPVTAGSCSGVDWTSVPEIDAGTITVTGDGTYTTTPTTLTTHGAGCYTYTDSLASTTSGAAAATSAGVPAETFILLPPPTVSTAANQSQPNPRTSVTDAVTITATYGNSGTATWSLLGPVTPIAGSCSTVDWTGATVNTTGMQSFTGDQTAVTMPTGGTLVQGVGCYSWAETVTGPNFVGANPNTGAGLTGEVFQVVPWQPTMDSTAVPASTGTANTVTDTVVIANSDLGQGNGAPSSAVLTWTLYGPYYPVPGGGCSAITDADWLATASQTGTNNVVNGTNTLTSSATITAVGCYTYTDSLAATADTNAVGPTSPGVTAETFQLVSAPGLTTSANQATPNPRATVSDSVTITGAGTFSGTVAWKLLGPISAVAGSCSGLTWTGAPVRHQSNQGFAGDQTNLTVPTAGTAAGAPGCYSWVETIYGPNFLGETAPGAGAAGETFDVPVLSPTLSTTMNTSVTGGVESATDSITVAGTDIAPGNNTGAPTSDSMTWSLLGPVTVPAGGCSAVTSSQWSAAPTAATATITVTGNGAYSTHPPTAPTDLSLASCYSYTETLAATTDSTAATSASGLAGETTEVPAAAVVSTAANQTTADPRTTVSDSVTITGTGGDTGSVAWSLVGPVVPVPAGGCGAVTAGAWTGASTYVSGSQSVTGDQTNLTVPAAGTAVGAPGCYSWADTVSGGTFPGSTTVAAGTTGEILYVPVLQPSLSTTINPSVAGGVESATDTVTVAGTDIAPGNITGAPTSGSIAWVLLGPVTEPAGGCVAVTGAQWTAAPHAASGTITVTANTTYTTPSTNLTLASCYSYTETLAATTDSAPSSSSAGLLAETTGVPAAPTVTTATSASLVYPHASVSDSVTITGIGAYNGNLAWALVGPVTPVTTGTCIGVNWSTAPGTPVGSGTIAISADGTVTTGPLTLSTVGCYGWTDTLTGTFPGTATITAGAAGEVVLVQPHQPVLATGVVLASGSGGTQSVVDDIGVSASGIATSVGSPPSAVLTWTLLGPLAPVAGACTGVSWTGAPTVDTGTIQVTGDGSYATPSDNLTATGCYSYTESLAATVDSLAATSAAGASGETTLLLPPPTITTATVTEVYPYSPVFDAVTVTGTDDQPGVVVWSLVGPVATATDGTCNGVSWTGAPTVASGTGDITADGDLNTGPTPVEGVGCYSWSDTFTGAAFLGQTQVAPGASGEVILVEPFQPFLTTHATLDNAMFHDTIDVSGTGIGSAPLAPTSAALTWTLLGPVQDPNDSCAPVTWTGQPVLATGTLMVTGDGTVVTPSTMLTRPGCYTFYEHLTANAQSDPASTDPGVAVETVYMPASALAPDGLGAISTDLGRWIADRGADATALSGTLGLSILGAAGFGLTRRRRRRRPPRPA